MSEEQSVLDLTKRILNSINSDQRVEFFGFSPRGITQTQNFYLKSIDDDRAIISNDAQTNNLPFKNIIPVFNNLRTTSGVNLLTKESFNEFFSVIPTARVLRIKVQGITSLSALSEMNSIMYEIRKLHTSQTFMVFRRDIVSWTDDGGIFSYVFENVASCMNARMFILTLRDKKKKPIEIIG